MSQSPELLKGCYDEIWIQLNEINVARDVVALSPSR